MKMLKLNIGCGSNKIVGYVNIDGEPACKPDLVHNLMESDLPYEDNTVDEIVFFHCIEHIRKIYHPPILCEFHRVLKPYTGKLYISYPNFWECAQRWHRNEGGQRTFWEATLYGRQLYQLDYHVCAMSPEDLSDTLYKCGFGDILHVPEVTETYNTITFAKKTHSSAKNYEQVIGEETRAMVIK